ncbi:aggregation-promoting factor C-terminal-like domain-containing protein [Geodermatophilus sp. URMC 64]
MNLRSTISGRSTARRRPPAVGRRPALYLGAAAAGAVMVSVLFGADPAAQAEAGTSESVSVAQQLGLTAQAAPADAARDLQPLEDLAASRSTREAEQVAAQQAQAAADQAELDRQKAEAEAKARAEAEAKAREEAEAKARQEAERAQAAPAAAPASSGSSSGSGSYQDYALSKLGGDTSEFSCLENLWGKESGWNPNAQNPTSTAYGIPQFLNSTWASTGIAKTSDPYRQIDAGLIYINNRYGSPCGAWSHSQSTGWY